MKPLRLLLLAAACALPLVAAAQWQWIDKDGRRVFSDQPPPPGTPPAKILRQPAGQPGAGAQPAEAPAAAPAVAATPAAPRLAGKDKELEDRKKRAEAEEAAKKKAKDEQFAAMKAENCTRAKQSKATLDSGVRVARMNDKGEREFLDDAQRAAETKRLEAMIARDCAPAQ